MGGASSSQVVGYRYYLGLHFGLAHRVEVIKKIIVGDRVAWDGSQGSGSISIDAAELFGGDEREGGVSGTLDILDGDAAQGVNDYLQAKIGGSIPAYRGVLSAVLRQGYIGTNPYLKNWAFQLKRTTAKTDGTAQWYSAKADINSGDMNPAHIIRECLTNSQWGMDYPESIIDDASFTAAADTLYAEDFGLSMQWVRPEAIEDFIERVADIIDGVTTEDPATGLIGLKLIRDDYTPAALDLFDESNVLALEEFERRAIGETVNELTLVYRDRDSNQDEPVTVQDIGNIQLQGAVIAVKRDYQAIPNATLAGRVAMRDLRMLSAPLSKLKIKVNRSAWSLHRGDVFRFSWAAHGLSEVVYRVASIDEGLLTDSTITIDALEDVFALPTSTYVGVQPSGWVSPNNAPIAVTYQRALEASYWDIVHLVSAADQAQLDPDYGFALLHAVRPLNDAIGYSLYTRSGAAAYADQGRGRWTPSATLSGGIGAGEGGFTDVLINVVDPVDLDLVELDTLAYLGSEAVAVRAIDTGAGTVTIDRGVLDSVPVAHGDGERLWFSELRQGVDLVERIDAESVSLKALTITGLGMLAEASAPAAQVTMAKRAQRPYPPGNVRINTAYFPASFNEGSDLVLAWSHRDRTQQTAGLDAWDTTDIGPEAGTTYTVSLYDETDTLLRTETSIATTTYTYTEAMEWADTTLGRLSNTLRVVIKAVRDGLDSSESFDYTITRHFADQGFNLDQAPGIGFDLTVTV